MPARDIYRKNREKYIAEAIQWQRDNVERYRIWSRKYLKKWRKISNSHSKSAKKYAENNPEKILAYYLVKQAIITGKLKKGNCEICKKQNVHAHHDNYFKPLEVKWFCPLHHKAYHRQKLC